MKNRLKTLYTPVATKNGLEVGAYVKYEKLTLLILAQKLYFNDDDAINDVICMNQFKNDIITKDRE